MISKIEDQYQPARIPRSRREDTNHIKNTDFLIPKLERPKPPEKPELVRTRKLRTLENVDTIRFQNFLAKNNPTECVKYIQQLLA